MNLRNEIDAKLAAYRARLTRSFHYPEHRVALLQLLRCVDYETFVEYIYKRAGQERPEAERNKSISRLFGWGLNEALSAFWGDHVHEPGIPLFRSNQELKDWGDSVLQCAGKVRLIEHVLELERVQLGKISRSVVDANKYEFRCADNAIGVEGVQRDEGNYFNVLLEKTYERLGVWKKLEERRGPIISKMESLVKPQRRHYIRYNALPEVDEYYSDLSSAIAPTREGWDAFPLTALFGGIPFIKYVECVRILMGFALKHVDFCVLLSNRNTNVKAIDILTVPCKWLDKCRYTSYALDVSEAESEQIMLTTCLGPENAQHHFAIPAGPLASHYMIGTDSAVRLITGCLHNPFHFMLRELRRRYPLDWDKSVDSREGLFREDLSHAFSRFNRIVFFTDNIDINTSLGKTDIDVLMFDTQAKVVGIFQLKWQEPFCGSVRERESRKTNFLNNGNAWVEKVSEWLVSGKLPRTLISLGMPKHIASDIQETRVFVLGRNFSHFSGEFNADLRAAWGSWPQVQRLLDVMPTDKSPLALLHDQLKEDAPTVRAGKLQHVAEIKVGGLTMAIHPAGTSN